MPTTKKPTKKTGKMTTKNHTPDKVLAKKEVEEIPIVTPIDLPIEKPQEETKEEAPKKTKEPQKFTILVHEIHEITFSAPTRRVAKKMAKDKTVLDAIEENTFFERTIVVKSLKHKI